MLPVALLSGGLAVRMRPDTVSLPKAMLAAAGKPFIEHQLNLLRDKGASRLILCLGHLGGMIEEFVGDGGRFGLDVSYSYDGEKLLGTGGALKKAAKGISGPFFVLYGDSWLDVDYVGIEEAFRRQGAACKGLMTVYRNEGRWDSSNVVFEGGEIVRYSKKERGGDMKYIDYGLGILSAQVFDEYERDCSTSSSAFDLADIYEWLAGRKLLMGYEVFERFYEIGSATGLKDFEQMIVSRS